MTIIKNEDIKYERIRIAGGEIMETNLAIQYAKDMGMDLIMVSDKADIPVCKIIEYGKYKYEQTKRDKNNKRKQIVSEIKEIKMSPNIEQNDINTKLNAARKFLSNGDKVKLTIRCRGREVLRINSYRYILDGLVESLKDVAVVDKNISINGRQMSVVIKSI